MGARAGWGPRGQGETLRCHSFAAVLTVSFLGKAVAPVGSTGTIHYRLASLPYTSGSLLGFDLDVSSCWVTGLVSRYNHVLELS